MGNMGIMGTSNAGKDKKFTPINSYKPIGELIELK
jgi:hypothetical protein